MKKFLSLVMALVMTMSLVTISAGAKDFADDSKITYKEAVDVVSAVKIVDGYADGSFNPSATLTRGAAAKIICNMILGPTTAGALVADAAPFKDVPANSTFAGYIAYCSKEGIISGYSDGTFKPGNTLTGYAFMKMLLGALGYDKTTEGYEGANWSIQVAKRALAIGLDSGLTDDFNGTKPVTREEAALYAFNTLKATMVKYDNNSTITVGDITISTSAKVSDQTWTAGEGKDYKGGGSSSAGETVEFCEKYFPKLSVVDQVDVYGRPGNKWVYNKTTVGTYGKEADAVYTKDTKLYTVKTDVGAVSTSTKYYYTINGSHAVGEDQTGTVDHNNDGTYVTVNLDAYTSASTTKLSAIDGLDAYIGNGVTVEVFYDKDDEANNKLILIDEFKGEVTDVDTDDDGRYIEIDNQGKFYTEEFELEDDVLYTVGVNPQGDNSVFASVKPAEKLTGTLTKIVGSKLTISGTTYEMHMGVSPLTSSAIGETVEFFLDSNGYIIDIDAVTSSNIENLVVVTETKNSGFDQIAKVVYATGKTETVTLKDADSVTTYYTYSFTTSSGKMKLKTASDYSTFYGNAGSYYFTKGATTVQYKTGANAYGDVVKVNNKTTFVYVKTNGEATAYTGYKNAPSITGTGAYAVTGLQKDGVAKVVFVWLKSDSTVSSSDKTLTYFIGDEYDYVSEKKDNGDDLNYYEVQTLDGRTVRVDTALSTDIAAYENKGVLVYTSLNKDEDGIYTKSGSSAKADSNIIADTNSSDVIKEEDGVLSLYDTTKRYADDVTVYVIEKTGTDFNTIKVTSINKGTGKYQGYTAILDDDGVVTTLILKKA